MVHNVILKVLRTTEEGIYYPISAVEQSPRRTRYVGSPENHRHIVR